MPRKGCRFGSRYPIKVFEGFYGGLFVFVRSSHYLPLTIGEWYNKK
jgi:membrane protease subunit (stomatin/prohibitin family)